uniref:BRCT domain-containing protein n=1 Tax=Anisakis simplex TaxID=6269 RepID=A0A0M3JGC5_ANISI
LNSSKESEAVNIVEASLLPCNGEIVDDDVIDREEVTVDKLRDMLDKIDTTKESISDSAGATNALRDELLKDEKFHRFANMIFYLHESVPSIMTQYVRTVLRMHGGEISDELEDCVTHLVVEDCDNVSEELSAAHSTGKLVNIKWIEEAVEL